MSPRVPLTSLPQSRPLRPLPLTMLVMMRPQSRPLTPLQNRPTEAPQESADAAGDAAVADTPAEPAADAGDDAAGADATAEPAADAAPAEQTADAAPADATAEPAAAATPKKRGRGRPRKNS